MKRLRQRWMKFIERHFMQFDPYVEPPVVPTANASVLRCSVNRYFRYNQPDLLYMLPYEPMYTAVIENMREDGWQVALHVNEGGKLIYSISAKPTPVLPVFIQ